MATLRSCVIGSSQGKIRRMNSRANKGTKSPYGDSPAQLEPAKTADPNAGSPRRRAWRSCYPRFQPPGSGDAHSDLHHEPDLTDTAPSCALPHSRLMYEACGASGSPVGRKYMMSS